jgi:hypothetical protein
MTFGSDDLPHGLLRISPDNFSQTPTAVVPDFSFSNTIGPLGVTSTSLIITLKDARPPSSTGVRVTGRAGLSAIKSVYLSGNAGLFFTDGTFEFRGVTAGIYALTTPDNREHPRGGLVVVGERDLDGIELEDASMLPSTNASPAPLAATNRPPGPLPLPSLRGRVVELASKQPIKEGLVILKGASRAEFDLANGGFEIPRLVPGAYTIEIQVFGHANLRQDIVIGDSDVLLELTAERLY